MNPFAYIRDLYRWYQLSKVPQNKQEEKPYVPWVEQNNGLVVIQDHAFKDTSINTLSIAGMSMPPETEYMLCRMNHKDLYELQIWINFTTDSEDDAKLKTMQDIKRGLSIGSLIFGYQIPQSSVLIDRRTRLLRALYLWNYEDRRPFEQWVEKENDMFMASHGVISKMERTQMSFAVNMPALLEFYQKHHGFLIGYILQATNEQVTPHINGFVRSVLTRLNLSTDQDNLIHYVRCCMSVIIVNLEVKIPVGWVMISEMVDKLQDAVYGVDTKPQLTLVVDNSLYESKPL